METVKAIASAFAALFGWSKQRSEVRNAPAMQANAAARTDAAQADQATASVAAATQSGAGLDNLRERLGE